MIHPLMRWKRNLFVIGMVILITIPTFFFTLKGRKASLFFREKDLGITANFLTAEIFDNKLHLLYSKGDKLIYQEHKLTGDLLYSFSFEIPHPIYLDLYVYGSSLFGVYQSDSTIYFLDIAKEQAKPLFEGSQPKLFSNAGNFYLAFIRDNTLYVHKFEQENSLWIIDIGVDSFTITETYYRTFVTYLKSGVIFYRMCDNNAWYESYQFIKGTHPVLAPIEAEINYLYYGTNHTLSVGYGISFLSHSKEIFAGDISSITAIHNDYKNNAIIAFVSKNTIYLQEVYLHGISHFIEIGEGSEPQLLAYETMVIVLYRIGMNYFTKILIDLNNDCVDFYPIKLDTLQINQPTFSSWRENYNTYYGTLWAEKFEVIPPALKWFVDHPFETTIILFLGGILLLIFVIWAIFYLKKLFSKQSIKVVHT